MILSGESGLIAVSSKRKALQLCGLGMKSAHAGMDITHAEFNALVGDPVTTLKKCKVGERRQFELLSVLSPMGQDIVERQ